MQIKNKCYTFNYIRDKHCDNEQVYRIYKQICNSKKPPNRRNRNETRTRNTMKFL